MESAWEKVMSIKQEGTLISYCNEFKFLFKQVKNFDGISEGYGIYLFISGLENKIRDIFIDWHQYSYNTVEEMISLALKIDANKLQDSFSPFDLKSSFYIRGLVFDFKKSLNEIMEGNESFKDGKTQEISNEDRVFSNSVYKVFDEMPQRVSDEIEVLISDKSEIRNVISEIHENVNEIQELFEGDDAKESDKENESNQAHVDLCIGIDGKGINVECVSVCNDLFSDNLEKDRHESKTLSPKKIFEIGLVDLEIRKKRSDSLFLPDVLVTNQEEGELKSKALYRWVHFNIWSDYEKQVDKLVGVLGSTKELDSWKKNQGGEIMEFKIVVLLVEENKIWEVGLVASKPRSHWCLGLNGYVKCEDQQEMHLRIKVQMVSKGKTVKVWNQILDVALQMKTSSCGVGRARKGEPESTAEEILSMVISLASPPHCILLFHQQSYVEWCWSLWLDAICDIVLTFRRTLIVVSMFDNRLKEFTERWGVDRYLSESGYLGENMQPIFVALSKEGTAFLNDEFRKQISQVDSDVIRHLKENVKGGYDEEKYKSLIGFGCLRDYLEVELHRRYKEATPSILALLEQCCSEVTAQPNTLDSKIQATFDVAHLRKSAMQFASSIYNHMGAFIEGNLSENLNLLDEGGCNWYGYCHWGGVAAV